MLRKRKDYVYLNRIFHRRVWRRILVFLGCIVVFVTTYALILPAITQEQDSSIRDLLEGDNAFLSSVGMSVAETQSGQAISTGTSPWDESSGAGNDTAETDNIVRTFDLVTYTVHYETSLQKEALDEQISGYKEGRVYFEFVLPLTEKEAQFATDESVMRWLTTSKEADYEITTMQMKVGAGEDAKEQEVQVLHGSFLETPTENQPVSIGASRRELTVAVRVLAMKNENKITPQFTFWLAGNDVGTTYKAGKNGEAGRIPEMLVTGSGYGCKTHQTQEYQTVEPETITVSAEPRYNVQIKENSEDAGQYLGTWDLSTGNGNALVKKDFQTEGRLVGFELLPVK